MAASIAMTTPADAQRAYLAPPRPHGTEGKPRKVGVELELAHLDLDQTLRIVRDVFGGAIEVESRTKGAVRATRFGEFKVELDSKPLQNRVYLKPLEALGLEAESPAAEALEESVLQVARHIVPLEIVSPPIAWNELHDLDPLWAKLREAGAEDTRSFVLYAFGLHFNPEPPDFEVSTILNTIRAFLLLEDWISNESDIDLARKVAPFIRGFPESYRRKVLAPDYAPSWDRFVHDFVEENPTRNRPIDLMPLIAHVGHPDISGRVEDWQLVKPRPTFHYRLPNSEVSQPGWTPAADWNRWVAIERVAEDAGLLRELSEAYLRTPDLPLRAQRTTWAADLQQRLSL
jgi:hypothetical protein